MRLLDRIREQEIVRTNSLGREKSFPVGRIVERDGVRYRVTRHKGYPMTPDWTWVIYGVRQGALPCQEC